MRLNFGGQLFSYEKEGSGPTPVLFLHGWGTSHDGFITIARYLGKNYTCYLLDLPGFGQASLNSEISRVAELSQYAFNFLKAIGSEKTILVGHGLTGKIMISLAARFPKAVEWLILADVTGLSQDRWLKHLTKIVASNALRWRLPGLFEYRRDAKSALAEFMGIHDYAMARLMADGFNTILNFDSLAPARLVSVKTFIICGRHDRGDHIKDASRYHKVIKNSQIYELKNAGHLSAGLEPDNFAKALLSAGPIASLN